MNSLKRQHRLVQASRAFDPIVVNFGCPAHDGEQIESPCKGASGRMVMPWQQSIIIIFEGTRRQQEGASVSLILHDTDALKLQLLNRLAGKGAFRWHIPSNCPAEYCKQVVLLLRSILSGFVMGSPWGMKG